MYKISLASYELAKIYNLDIFPSTKAHKKIDVWREGVYLDSIGDIRFNDYHIYLKKNGKAFAEERRRLYYIRQPKDTFKERLSKLYYAATKPGSSINVPKQCHAMTLEPRHYCVEGIALSLIGSL
jgi:hypothetical protein